MSIPNVVVLLLIMAGLTGCSSRDFGYVQREWSMTLRELGISPIFPPREDVVVGDIYAFSYDPDDDNIRRIFETRWTKLNQIEKQQRLELGMSPRLARLSSNIDTLILSEYMETLSAPATTSEYNSLLGNPALAAASEQVANAKKTLGELKKKIADARENATDAQQALVAAQREKLDKDTAVKIAQAKLDTARSAPVDVSVQELRLKAVKEFLRTKVDAVIRAQRSVSDAGDDPLKKSKAMNEQTQALRDKEDAEEAVRRAQEDLDAAKAAKPDLSKYETNLASAIDSQQVAAENVIKLQRVSEDKSAEAITTANELKEPIDAATREVEAAELLQTSIATAGTKFLYSQPRDAKLNIFDGNPLPHPKQSTDDSVNSRVNRLRLVAFPEFATTSFTQGDLAALIPIEAMMVGLNISSTNVDKVSVKISAAESYSLSLDKIIDKFAVKTDYNTWDLSPAIESAKRAALFQHGVKRESSLEQNNFIYLYVITEVFYARAMDISLFSANSFGARVQAGLPNLTTDSTADSSSSTQVVPIVSSITGSTSAAEMLKSIQNRFSMTQTVPGGSIQVVSYSDQSIGLRRVFDRPIAIGSRGLVVTYDKCKQQIVNVSAKGSSVPSLK